ncbi:hypothetical protein ACFV20_19440 [Streptomyces sp. NPDC059696]|uniref:zinc finger domain-containing protein n=1 Tax=Streptomyces sp. NPDC059696 TaxID=3346911 RepID=UPI0036BC8B7C
MNSKEAAVLCRYVRAACPQQKFDEYTADAWYDILAPYNFDDARQAAARIAHRQPFVAPSEIAAEISKIRSERTHDFVYEPPTGDRDPNYLERYRQQLAATGDGARPPVIAKELPKRPVAELLGAVGRQVPAADVSTVRRPGPLGVECPACRAAIGRPCRMAGGRERAPHEAREHAVHGREHDPAAEEQRRKNASRHLTEETNA